MWSRVSYVMSVIKDFGCKIAHNKYIIIIIYLLWNKVRPIYSKNLNDLNDT